MNLQVKSYREKFSLQTGKSPRAEEINIALNQRNIPGCTFCSRAQGVVLGRVQLGKLKCSFLGALPKTSPRQLSE